MERVVSLRDIPPDFAIKTILSVLISYLTVWWTPRFGLNLHAVNNYNGAVCFIYRKGLKMVSFFRRVSCQKCIFEAFFCAFTISRIQR